MPRDEIALGLKSGRTSKNLTVEQVSAKLKEKGFDVAEKTIYGWESGHRQPDADILMALCDIYGIDDIFKAFGYKKEIEPLSESELDAAIEKEGRELVELINQLSPEDQQKSIMEIILMVNRLSPQKQQALTEFLRVFSQTE